MRVILALLILSALASAQIELSVLNYGGNWQARDDAYVAARLRLMDNHVKSDTIYQLYHYRYYPSDSSVSFIDVSQDSVEVIERYYDMISGKLTECGVETIWLRLSKASPAKASTIAFSKSAGWSGGPKKPGIKPAPVEEIVFASIDFLKKQASVNSLMKSKDKVWKDKDNKTIKAANKRSAAWSIVKGKTTGVTIDGKPAKLEKVK